MYKILTTRVVLESLNMRRIRVDESSSSWDAKRNKNFLHRRDVLLHSPLSAIKSFFQFWSQMSISHPQRPKPYLPHCSEAPRYLKFMCEVLNFKKTLDVASKRFLFYTIKCTKYQKNLGKNCQF